MLQACRSLCEAQKPPCKDPSSRESLFGIAEVHVSLLFSFISFSVCLLSLSSQVSSLRSLTVYWIIPTSSLVQLCCSKRLRELQSAPKTSVYIQVTNPFSLLHPFIAFLHIFSLFSLYILPLISLCCHIYSVLPHSSLLYLILLEQWALYWHVCRCAFVSKQAETPTEKSH